MADRLFICKHNDGLGHCDVFGGEYCVESPCQHEELVEYAPVVHGEWEHLEIGWHDLWRCTSCGDEWTFEYDPTDKETMVNFCPNCGADMRERKGDDAV